jgi:hypothetical protein
MKCDISNTSTLPEKGSRELAVSEWEAEITDLHRRPDVILTYDFSSANQTPRSDQADFVVVVTMAQVIPCSEHA